MRRAVRILVGALLASIFAWGIASPQSVVRQGEPEKNPNSPKKFTSPMIIETDLLGARAENLSKRITTKEFAEDSCDSVHINSLQTQVWLSKKRARVSVGIETYTEPGHDKSVNVDVLLLSAGEPIAVGTIWGIDAEEGEYAHKSITLKIPRSAWPTEAMPRVRLTVKVIDD